MSKVKKTSQAITMKDVADYIGVSTATVSYVINGNAPISEETKIKVLEAIKELNYKPNALARGLRVNETKLIGLIVPDITSEFYNYFARGFIDEAYKKGYTALLCGSQYNLEREKLEVETFLEKRVDGLVFVGGVDDDTFITELVKKKTPVVLADRYISDIPTMTVQFDNHNAMKRLIKYLKGKGYSKIGYISEPLEMTNLIQRFEGFKNGLDINGLEFKDKYIYIDNRLQLNKVEESKKLIFEIVDGNRDLPEVFITTSDLIAAGVIDALKERNILIPDEIAVTGFDDNMIARYLNPKLTTVYQDKVLMGKKAWSLMEKLIESIDNEVNDIVLEGELKIRESC